MKKVRCIKELLHFKKNNEYYSDNRLFEDDEGNKQVLIIESLNDDNTENTYFINFDKFINHFIKL